MTNHRDSLTLLYKNISNVIVGKKESVILALVTLLCKGHLLIEDAPGLGKTMLARALAKSMEVDLLPSDITGVSIYNQKTAAFDFMKGPVFTNILLADEINRTTPRTQSSLLESMAEFQVTVDGETYALPEIFMVIATQNPIEYHGTYPLPEAQLDRFFMKISMGYPSLDDEVKIMQMQSDHHPIDDLKSVMLPELILQLQKEVTKIHVEPNVHRYIADIVKLSREHPDLTLGASPRGSIALMKAAQAMALVSGQDYVDPQFIKKMAVPVLAHRIILKSQSRLTGKSSESILKTILEQVKVPVAAA